MKLLSFSYFCIIAQIFIAIASAQVISRASYGENCSKEIRCESRNFLSCSNGLCDCLMPDTMVFDETVEKCVTLAGERCQYNTVEAESTWTEEVPCISNAVCRNGICECNSTYYEISNGTCQPKRNHGEDCISNEMCNDGISLVCSSEKKCICGPNRNYYNGVCILSAGNKCTPNDQCTKHSSCVLNTAKFPPITACLCDKSYFQAENGTCEEKRKIGDDCTTHEHCIDTIDIEPQGFISSLLFCIGGRCQCNAEISAEENDLERFCGKLVGQSCGSDLECFTGSECSSGSCKCKTGYYEENSNKTCQAKRSFGEFCYNSDHCQRNLRCDTTKNKCACEPGNSFSPLTSSCVVSAGHVCYRYNRYSNNHNQVETCVPNTICSGDRYSNDRYCVCNEDAEKTSPSDGYCYIKADKTCDGDTFYGSMTPRTCLPGLACRGGTCTCLYKEHQLFQPTTQKCLSYVGGPCNKTGDCLDGNAECSKEDEVLQCQCKKGFTQVGRSCDLAYGEKCGQGRTDPRCDRFGPLECSIREICECSDFQIYDKESLTCKGLAGAKCKFSTVGPVLGEESFCVEGAACHPFRGFEKVFGQCKCLPGWKAVSNRSCEAKAIELTSAVPSKEMEFLFDAADETI